MAVAAGGLSLGLATAARAAGVVGNGTSSSCSEAAFDSALAGGGRVTFACGRDPVTITLTRQKVITSDTSLDGDGRITLDGKQSVRLLAVARGTALGLANLTIANGGSEPVGAVMNAGRLEVNGCTFSGNSTGIVNEGALTVADSTFAANWGGDAGSAISNIGGSVAVRDSVFSGSTGRAAAISSTGNAALLTVTDSTFSGNSAGGIYGQDGTVTATGSTFTGNGEYAVFNSDGTLTVVGCTFSANAAVGIVNGGFHGGTATVADTRFSGNRGSGNGGGISNGGTLAVEASTFSGNLAYNYGGAIYNSPTGVLTLSRSTVNDNSAYNGGGLHNDSTGALQGRAILANSTFSGNSAGLGGGIVNLGEATFANCTLAGNTATAGNAWGGGLYNGAGHVATLANNILFYNNSGLSDCINRGGTIVDGGHNLLGDESCLLWSGVNGNLVGVDPKLDPSGLMTNGGPTRTIAILSGSPAIDAGDPTVCEEPPVGNVDQRGYARPGTGSANCSIGAYEYESPGPPAGCTGDCNGGGEVTVDELITVVNIALGNVDLAECAIGDADGDGTVTVDELVRAVNFALEGCGPPRVS